MTPTTPLMPPGGPSAHAAARSIWQVLPAVGLAVLVLAGCGGNHSATDARLLAGQSSTSSSTGSVFTSVTTLTSNLPTFSASYALPTDSSVVLPMGSKVTLPTFPFTEFTFQKESGSYTIPAGSIVSVPTTPLNTTTVTVTAITRNWLATLTAPQVTVGWPAVGIGTVPTVNPQLDGRIAVEPTGTVVMASVGGLWRIDPNTGSFESIQAPYSPYGWSGVAVDTVGTLYGSGTTGTGLTGYGAVLHKFVPSTGSSVLIAGNWAQTASDDTVGKYSVAVDGSGYSYVADTLNHRIVKISPTGTMTVLAGSGKSGFANGTGAAAAFSRPRALALDRLGNVLVADTGNNAIRRVSPTGDVSVVARALQPTAIAVDSKLATYFIANNVLHRVEAGDTRMTSLPPINNAPNPVAGSFLHLAVSGSDVLYATHWNNGTGYNLYQYYFAEK